MSNRRKTRETAMQVLFAWDAAGEDEAGTASQIVADADLGDESARQAMAMARGTWDQRSIIDPRLERLAPQWPVRRQPGVDRSLLRLAVWEMTNETTPPKVVIDEAIELAKQFSTEHSAGFINGVLDAIKRENDELKAGLPTQ